MSNASVGNESSEQLYSLTQRHSCSAATTTFSMEVFDSEVVPSSLHSVASILRVSKEIQNERPRIAYLCCFYALEKASRLDPNSSGCGVKQFKTGLQRLEQVKETDAREIESFSKQYYEHYVLALNKADRADRAQHSKAYQTVGVLFEVLCAVSKTEKVEEVPPEIKAAANDVQAKKGIYAHYNILTVDSSGASQTIMQLDEVKASVAALWNAQGLSWPASFEQQRQKAGELDLLDWLRTMLGFQSFDNVDVPYFQNPLEDVNQDKHQVDAADFSIFGGSFSCHADTYINHHDRLDIEGDDWSDLNFSRPEHTKIPIILKPSLSALEEPQKSDENFEQYPEGGVNQNPDESNEKANQKEKPETRRPVPDNRIKVERGSRIEHVNGGEEFDRLNNPRTKDFPYTTDGAPEKNLNDSMFDIFGGHAIPVAPFPSDILMPSVLIHIPKARICPYFLLIAFILFGVITGLTESKELNGSLDHSNSTCSRYDKESVYASGNTMRKLLVRQVNYFKLVLQWPNAYCNQKDGIECKLPTPQDFTIHGLWPVDGNDIIFPHGDWDEQNQLKEAQIVHLRNELDREWPELRKDRQNFDFWAEQWWKHGMDTGYSPRDYFRLALSCKRALDLKTGGLVQLFYNTGLSPDSTIQYTGSQFARLLTKQFRDTEIVCNEDKYSQSQLFEIHFCFTRLGGAIDCYKKYDPCRKKYIYRIHGCASGIILPAQEGLNSEL